MMIEKQSQTFEDKSSQRLLMEQSHESLNQSGLIQQSLPQEQDCDDNQYYQVMESPHLGPRGDQMTQSEQSFAANERLAYGQDKVELPIGNLNSTFDRQTLNF